jgi:hypothetical protein
MTESIKSFRVVIPAELSKGSDGDWIVAGRASKLRKDLQDETLLPDGIDASPIDEGRGIINWDHQKGPENILGVLDSYSKTASDFFVKGRLFKNHTKAKAAYEIMSSLKEADKGRMGLSVEGKILQRAGKDGKIIKKCQINAVALTMNPVNPDTYVDLVKSLNDDDAEVDFQATEENANQADPANDQAVFTAAQVMQLIEKALGVGAGAVQAPTARSGGDALVQEDLETKPKTKAKLKKVSKDLYKSGLIEILDKVCILYPNNSRAQVWSAIKDRLERKFPELAENAN